MIPLFKVHVPPNLSLKLQEVFDSGVVTEGAYSDEFEQRLKDRFGSPTSLTNSGTSALTLAYRLAGVGPGTEVITTPMTCMATKEPIDIMGAKIVWADIDPSTGNIDPASVARRMTKNTVAVVGVHWAGLPVDSEGIYDVIRQSGQDIKLITDAAHAFGSTYKGKPIGSESDYVCFSFQAIKHLTTIDGGALCTRSSLDDARAKKLRWFGLDRKYIGEKWSQDITDSGYKFHMNNVNAAIGLSQLDYIDELVRRHRENARFYDVNLKNANVIPMKSFADSQSANWIYTVKVQDRDGFKKYMNARGIACDIVHFRNDKYSVFKRFIRNDLPGVDEFCSTMINVPVGWWLSIEERNAVLRAMNEYTP